jgi:uncharacterized protein YgfB (UPF0149 family)
MSKVPIRTNSIISLRSCASDEDSKLREQADTLIQWCQGFLVGLGLQKVSTTDEDVLEMIKDFSCSLAWKAVGFLG